MENGVAYKNMYYFSDRNCDSMPPNCHKDRVPVSLHTTETIEDQFYTGMPDVSIKAEFSLFDFEKKWLIL